MATDYFSWTVSVARHELPIDSRNWVVYELPDAVSDAMGRDDAICTSSGRDRLHFSLRALIQAFGATSLAFLDRGDPPKADDKAGTVCEGFVVSALMPEDVSAALAEIDEILHDADRLSRATELGSLSDDDLAQWREKAYNGEFADDDDFVRFLVCLQWVLEDAQTRGDVVAHAHYVYY